MPRAIIIGGGICGLTTAAALQRVGIEFSIYEQASELRELGAGLTLWGNGIFALDVIGLAAKAITCGQIVEDFRFLNGGGELLGTIDLSRLRKLSGFPSLSVHRRSLHKMLSSQIPAEHVHLGRRFSRYVREKDGVRVFFEDGVSERADFLLACDGFHSRVREQMLGDNSSYQGYTCYRSVYKGAPLKNLPRGGLFHTASPGKQFGILDLGDAGVGWYATVNVPSGVHESFEERKEQLLKHFAGQHAPIGDLLAKCDPSLILRNDIYDRPPVYKWSDGPVLLMGDAAHPTTPNLGQGACQAIEDAVVLSRLFVSSRNCLSVFRDYEKRRMRRASYVVRASRRSGQFSQNDNPYFLGVKDELIRALLKGGRSPQLDRTAGYKLSLL